MGTARGLPRGVLFGLGLLHAAVFAGAVATLPWALASAFSILAGIVAAAFLLLALCAAVLPSRLGLVFRGTSAIALAFLAWATWELGSTSMGTCHTRPVR